ncbi:hypothetical protein CPC08DRAFT_712143 [Agrocybe pediades]|nr:hypothetical protein CPC08DRAFT_712143 [Agrocybe pediades]
MTKQRSKKKCSRKPETKLERLRRRLQEDPRLHRLCEFHDLQQGLSAATAIARKYRRLKKANCTWDIKAVSFSQVKQSDLERLGLHMPRDTIEIPPNIPSCLRVNEKLSIKSFGVVFLKSEEGKNMKKRLRALHQFCSDSPESAARIVVDQLLLAMIGLLPELNIELFLFPELRIVSAKDQLVVYHGSFSTLVTGLEDYAIMKYDAPSNPNFRASAKAVHGLSDLMDTRIWLNHSGFLPVEVKPMKRLPAHLIHSVPQVITQALAIMIRTRTKCVQWCLTNGLCWVFGVLYSTHYHEENQYGSRNDSYVVMLNPVELDIGSKERVTETLEQLIPLLLSWILCTPEQLLETFFNIPHTT